MQVLMPGFSCIVKADGEITNKIPGAPEPEVVPSELEQAIAQGYSFIYILTPAGIIKHHCLTPGKDGAPRYIRTLVKEIPGFKFKEYGEAVRFLPDGKVPIELFHTVKAFFKEVIKKKGTAVEAMIWVMWSQERGYFLHVPNQVVAHASAVYDWNGVPAGATIVIDIHSHADFSAFFSGTDDNDDRNSIRFSAVVGDNTKPKQSFKARFNYMGARMEVDLETMFEEQTPQTEVPEDWLDAVQLRSYTPPGHVAGMQRSPQHQSQLGLIQYGQGAYHGFPQSGGYSRIVHPAPGSTEQELEEAVEEAIAGRRNRRAGKAEASGKEQAGAVEKDGGKKKHFGEQKTTSESNSTAQTGQNDAQEDPHIDQATGEIDTVTIDGVDYAQTQAGLIPVSAMNFSGRYTGGYRSRLDALNEAFGALPDDAEDRVHRAGSEGLESASEENVVRGEVVQDINEEIARIMKAEEIVLPADFDAVACSHGLKAAKMYAVMDLAASELTGQQELLRRAVADAFNLIDDDTKIKVFRDMYEALPQKAKTNLANNGL